MAFGGNSTGTDGGTVLKVRKSYIDLLNLFILTESFFKYVTGISRRSVPNIVKPEASSVSFDREGGILQLINM